MAKNWKLILRTNLLTILTIVGMVSGTLTGCVLRHVARAPWTDREVMYLAFSGDLFLRMLKAMCVPLLMASVISAVGSLDFSLSKRIAVPTMLYYVTTTLFAVTLGVILVTLIQPGVGVEDIRIDGTNQSAVFHRKVLVQDTFLDLIRNLFPSNIVEACIKQSQTYLIPPDNFNITDDVSGSDLVTWKFKEVNENGTNMLGLIVFSVAFGISIAQLGDKAKPFQLFFEAFSEAIMGITTWIIWLSPIGIFFLVAAKLVNTSSFADLVGRLGLYFTTVLLGLVLHAVVILPAIYFIMLKRLPFRYISQLGQIFATSFGTASSTATMPVTFQVLDSLGLDQRVTRFVIPLGATINMDGTALYEAVAVIFIAQLKGISITFAQTVAICITATASSMGAPAVPQAGIVAIVIVLSAVGLPPEEVINIIAVDWLLDRCRTMINVISDCLGANIISELNAERLNKQSEVDRMKAQPAELDEVLNSGKE